MADFTYLPDFPIKELVQYKTLRTDMENGFQQVRSKWNAPLRRWELPFGNRTQTEFNGIRNFFIAKSGAFQSFTWENPIDVVTYTVRFDGDGLQYQKMGHDRFNIKVKFIQVT